MEKHRKVESSMDEEMRQDGMARRGEGICFADRIETEEVEEA